MPVVRVTTGVLTLMVTGPGISLEVTEPVLLMLPALSSLAVTV